MFDDVGTGGATRAQARAAPGADANAPSQPLSPPLLEESVTLTVAPSLGTDAATNNVPCSKPLHDPISLDIWII